MSLPRKLFCKLPELAKKWNTTDLHILSWGAEDQLAISACLNILKAPWGGKDFFEGTLRQQVFVRIKSSDLLKFALGSHTVKAGSFYDDEGNIITHSDWVALASIFLPSDLTIHLDDLLIRTDEIDRMEAKYPELSTVELSLLSAPVTALSFNGEVLSTPVHKGQILIGWKAIAGYLEVSVSTSKRYARGCRWPLAGPTGKPTTTTAELDAWRLSTSKQQKKRGAK